MLLILLLSQLVSPFKFIIPQSDKMLQFLCRICRGTGFLSIMLKVVFEDAERCSFFLKQLCTFDRHFVYFHYATNGLSAMLSSAIASYLLDSRIPMEFKSITGSV